MNYCESATEVAYLGEIYLLNLSTDLTGVNDRCVAK
jgi:hypothetical protein